MIDILKLTISGSAILLGTMAMPVSAANVLKITGTFAMPNSAPEYPAQISILYKIFYNPRLIVSTNAPYPGCAVDCTIQRVATYAVSGKIGDVHIPIHAAPGGILSNFDDAPFINFGTQDKTYPSVSGGFQTVYSGLKFPYAYNIYSGGSFNVDYPDGTSYRFFDSGAQSGVSVTISSVPEPDTWFMLLVGLGVLGASVRRRKTSIRFGGI